MANSVHQYKLPVLIIGVLFAIWGVFGWVDITHYAQAGYNTDGNNTITEILPASPAEQAGLKVGDYIASIGGIETTNAAAFANQPRPAVGETRTFGIERDGAMLSIDVTYAEPVAERQLLAHLGQIVGFCFLVFTLLGFTRRPNAATLTLAIAGLCLGLAFLAGPYFETATVRSITNGIRNIITFMGLGALLHFLLLFPNPHPLTDKSSARLWLYGPPALAGLFLAYRAIMTPSATSGLNTLTNVLVGLVVVVYLLGSLIRMIKTFRTAAPEERASRGINLMMLGSVLGLAPAILRYLVIAVAPQAVLPGQNFYVLAVVLVPVTWSLAAMRATH